MPNILLIPTKTAKNILLISTKIAKKHFADFDILCIFVIK